MQSLTVAEAMTTPAPTIVETASLQELRDRFRFYNSRSLSVVNAEGQLTGIVTLTDLQKAYEAGQYQHESVGDICTRDVITATPDNVLWKAIRLMGKRSIGRLPVVKPGTRELVGILRRHDIVQAYNLGISRKRERQHLAEQIRLNNLTDAHVFEVQVMEHSPAAGKRSRDIQWPQDCIVASIHRNGRVVVPHGETELKVGDRLVIVAALELEAELRALVQPMGMMDNFRT
jgi:CIC family chloride channel protein